MLGVVGLAPLDFGQPARRGPDPAGSLFKRPSARLSLCLEIAAEIAHTLLPVVTQAGIRIGGDRLHTIQKIVC